MTEKSEKKNKIYEQKRYFALALDPIYVGTGGYRIGRVDNTIVREPATGIPKIPGTTIEGVCRSYAFLKAKGNGMLDESKYDAGKHPLACAKGKKTKVKEKIEENDKEKIVEHEKEPCGNCEICVTFGYTTDKESMQAMASFSDARILFFPVATMVGPVWVTCPMVLKDAGIDVSETPESEKFIAVMDLERILPSSEGDSDSDSSNKTKILNFGWLLLEGECKEINPPIADIPKEILSRIVIISDTLFPTIVNSNLEVRTSVSIDPERGAAEEGALFTYEAIPRGTIFWFDITYQNPKYFGLDEWNIEIIRKTVEDGLKYFEFLGAGGMSSRGFGRARIYGDFLNLEEYLNALKERLDILKSRGRNEKIQEYIDYLKVLKSRLEKQKEEMKKLVEKIDKVINEVKGEEND